LVVAPAPKVAAWAAQPIANDQGGCRLTPLVLGAETLPRAAPEMLAGRSHTAMLQALMHCRGPADVPLFEQAMSTLETLSTQERLGYHEILRSCLAPTFLAITVVAMSMENTRWYQSFVERLEAEGEARGLERGRKTELLRVVTRQLGRRCGLPGPEARAKMEALSIETLEDLAEALLAFTSGADLEAWLSAR
jgi:hypothetical protein